VRSLPAAVREEWADGYRRLQAEKDKPALYEQLHAQVRVLTEELSRRVGSHYTLSQLAAAYPHADDWGREAVADRAAAPGWPRNLTVALAATFHLYSRGASDYEP
jgi:hypothetical protein